MYLCIYCQFLQASRKCLIMISPGQSITATIEGNVIDTIYVGELEIRTVLTYHCATYSVWLGQLLIVLYLTLTAKTLENAALGNATWGLSLHEKLRERTLFGCLNHRNPRTDVIMIVH